MLMPSTPIRRTKNVNTTTKNTRTAIKDSPQPNSSLEKRPSLFLFSVCCIMISSIKKIAYNIIIAIIQRMRK